MENKWTFCPQKKCYNCGKELENSEKLKDVKIVTGCPYCNKSFVDWKWIDKEQEIKFQRARANINTVTDAEKDSEGRKVFGIYGEIQDGYCVQNVKIALKGGLRWKMKELEKAKKNLKIFNQAKEIVIYNTFKKACSEHKQTCERWWGWILEKHKQDNIYEYQDKLKDLRETIKFYESQGIEWKSK